MRAPHIGGNTLCLHLILRLLHGHLQLGLRTRFRRWIGCAMAFIRLLLLAVMLSVLVVPGWSGVLATDNFVDDIDERCSGKCSAAALEGVHLLFAFNLYCLLYTSDAADE